MSMIDKLVGLFDTLDGPMTRDWIKKQRHALKPPQPATFTDAPSIAPGDDTHGIAAPPLTGPIALNVDAGESSDPAEVVTKDKEASRQVRGRPSASAISQSDVVRTDLDSQITAALLIVGKQDADLLAVASQGSEWQRATDQLAENSVVFVFTTMQMLLTIGQAIETFGCDRCANIYLLTNPDGFDAAKCDVLAIFERGDGVDVEGFPDWKPGDNPVYIAEQLLHGVPGRRLHFLAENDTSGWDALITVTE